MMPVNEQGFQCVNSICALNNYFSKEGVLLSSECAVKIYKTTLNEFKNRGAYVDGDHRFSRDDFKKNNPRKVIRIWGEKETANLNR